MVKTCKVCGEQKRRSEMGYNDTCLKCIEKGWDEYYQKKSKEELIDLYKSEIRKPNNTNKIIVFSILGVIVSFLFFKYISEPNIFYDLSFAEAAKEVFSQILTALGYCLVSAIAAVICNVVYISALSKLTAKFSKVIVTVLLCITAFVAYVYFLTA